MNPLNKSHYLSLFKNNISITTFCEWIFANKPKSYSHHFFKFYNESPITNLYVWTLSGLSWIVFHLVVSETFVINRPGVLTIIQQTIFTILVLWLMFMLSEWDCYIDIAKFIGCFNIRKAKGGGLLWSERHDHYSEPVHLQKQTGVSLAVAIRSAVVPLSFFLSLSLTLYVAYRIPVIFSLRVILGCPLLLLALWLYWSTIYLFIIKWIVDYILRYYIHKNNYDLKTGGYTVLWNVSVRKQDKTKYDRTLAHSRFR
jgi:hypothetical protein